VCGKNKVVTGKQIDIVYLFTSLIVY